MVSSKWLNSSIELTRTGTTTPDQNGHRSNGNKKILHIPQSPKNEASPLDGLKPYPRPLFSEYSTDTADWIEIDNKL